MTEFSVTSQNERLGVATVQLFFCKNMFIFREKNSSDIGIDAELEHLDAKNGKLFSSGHGCLLQIKGGYLGGYIRETTDHVRYAYVNLDEKHHVYWKLQRNPIAIIVVDLQTNLMYYCFHHMLGKHQHFNSKKNQNIKKLDDSTIKLFKKEMKNYFEAYLLGTEVRSFNYQKIDSLIDDLKKQKLTLVENEINEKNDVNNVIEFIDDNYARMGGKEEKILKEYARTLVKLGKDLLETRVKRHEEEEDMQDGTMILAHYILSELKIGTDDGLPYFSERQKKMYNKLIEDWEWRETPFKEE